MDKEKKNLLAQLKAKGLKESPPPDDDIEVISTGFSGFDNTILGIGGLPKGRFVEVYGQPASFKSNLAYRVIAQAQRQYPDKLTAYIDTEARFTKAWAIQQGIDTDLLQYHRTNTAEEIGLLMNQYIASGLFSVVVLDSLGNTITDTSSLYSDFYKESKGRVETKEQPGAIAKLVTRMMQQMTMPAARNDTLVLIINQLRDKIGVMYGSTETTPGGNNFGHDLTMRLRMYTFGSKGEILNDKKELIGVKVGVSVQKNTLGLCRKTDDATHLEFYFDGGIEKSLTYGLYDTAVRKGIIKEAGSWRTVFNPDGGEEVLKVQGRDNLIAKMLVDDKLRDAIYEYCDKVKADGLFGEEFEVVPEQLADAEEVLGLLE